MLWKAPFIAQGLVAKRPASKISKITSVQGCLSKAEFKKVKLLEEELGDKSSPMLVAELRKNSQSRTGKKVASSLRSRALCKYCRFVYIDFSYT